MIIFAIPPSGELKLAMVVNSRQGSQTDFDYLGRVQRFNYKTLTRISCRFIHGC